MKKLAVLILALILIIPAAAPALTTETQLIGSWAGEREANGETARFLFHFYNDGSVLKESYSFKRKNYDEPYIYASFGTWDRIGGVVNVHTESLTGGDFVTQLFLTEDNCLALPLATCYIVLTKLPETVKKSNIQLVDSWE